MKRRNLLSILLDWFCFSAVETAVKPDRDIDSLYRVAMKVHPSVYGLTRPSRGETTEEYLDKVVEQLETTGKALVWKITDMLGEVSELDLLPTQYVFTLPGGEAGNGRYEYHMPGANGAMSIFQISEKSIDCVSIASTFREKGRT